MSSSGEPTRPPVLPWGRWPAWFAPALAVALLVAYGVFVLGSIVVLLHDGWAIAGDPSEYLLTAHQGAHSGAGELPYVFPAMPALYAPVGAAGLSFGAAYMVADVVSGLLAIATALAFGVLGWVVARTRLGALAAAAAAASFPPLLDEVGWGGQAQFLAIILGTLGVAVLLAQRADRSALRAQAGAGVLFAVAALAEPYAAACFVVFGVAATAVAAGRPGLRPRALLGYVPIVGPCLAAVGALTLLAGPSAPQGLGSPVIVYAASTGGWGFALSTMGFANPWNDLGYGLVLAALAVAVVLGPPLSRRSLAAVIGALVGFLAEALVVTPATYAPRASCFFVAPLAVAAAVLVAGWQMTAAAPRATEQAPTGPPPRRSARTRRWVGSATAAVVVLVILVQVGAGFSAYPASLRFNAFDSAAVGDLTWLRGESGAVLLVAPENLTFPVAYATERPIYPAVQPFWFDTNEERGAAVLAETLATGAAWLDAGPVEVVDAGAPAETTAPSVFVYRSAYLIPVAQVVEEEGGHFAETVRARGSGGLGPRPAAPESGATLLGQSALPTYNVTTASSLDASGAIGVRFTFRATGSPSGPVAVGLAFPQVQLHRLQLVGTVGTASASFQGPGLTAVTLPFSATVAGNATTTIDDPVLANITGVPTLLWTVEPPTSSEFNASVTLVLPSVSPAVAELVTEAAALSSESIRWVVVDAAANATALPRFELDPLYAPVEAIGGFEVFRVL